MAQYAGQTLVWGLKTYDATGALADVGTGPTATVTKPDGTTGSATVAKTATGTYSATYASVDAGRYTIVWTGSGANSGGLPYRDVRDVLSTASLIISLADARASLNLPATATDKDGEILDYVAATTAVIEDLCGPLLSASRVETFDGDGTAEIFLAAYPTAISSVAVDGVTLAATAYKAGRGGVLYRVNGVWTEGVANVVVTYTVGGTTIPHNVNLAAREQLRFLWQIGQQGARPAMGAPTGGNAGYSPGYGVPNRVLELLGDHIGRYGPRHGG